MRPKRMFGGVKKRPLRFSVLCLVMLMFWGAMSLPHLEAAPERVDSVELPGVTGTGNNVAFAFDRYVLVAPYAPSNSVEEDGDLSQLDNHYLYIINTQKPNAEPKRKDLTTSEGEGAKTVYYPTKVVFDPETSVAYVRGTRYEQGEDGLIEVDVIAYVRLNLDDDGKAVFDQSVVVIDIRGIGTDYCDHAPIDFALAGKGKWLIFTNGASLFSFNIDKGDLYPVGIVPDGEYSESNSISFLDFDRASNTLVVCWNKKSKDKQDKEFNTSEISLYEPADDGTLKLLKRAYPEKLPAGSYLTPGSNVVVTADDKTGELESAFFVTSDGSLCQLEMDSGEVEQQAKVLETFTELAHSGNGPASPRLLRYDPSSRIISIVRQGFTAQIRKPANGKPGRRVTIRSLDTRVSADEPVLVVAKLGKKNKVVSSSVIAGEDGFEGGLTNTAATEDGQMLLAGYSGNLYTLTLGDDLAQAKLNKLGEIGKRIDRIDYYSSRTSVIAINSYGTDEDNLNISSPGSVVIARMGTASTQSKSFLQMIMSPVLAVAGPAPSIRRPCNIKK